jgi:DNA adenine methylase
MACAAAPHLVPKKWEGRYYEPFGGGAALFFALRPSRATLADRNAELMATYRAIRTQADDVIRLLRRYPYDEPFYYDVRSTTPRALATIAARLLYLKPRVLERIVSSE